MNTATRLAKKIPTDQCFLIVDECHKAASEYFRESLNIKTIASLGLSATPERQYDDGLNEVLVPSLGPVIFDYSYKDALEDRVIVPFNLKNIVFELEEKCKKEYDKLTKSIALSISKNGQDAEKTIALYIKRARVLNLSINRVRLAIKIVAANKDKRTLIFHEDIEACNLIHTILLDNKIKSGIYHSRMPVKSKVIMLQKYRSGDISTLVTCRALDEGFNVPETEIGIIAASTATRRQRIQRLGRIVRPAYGKLGATIYTLVATPSEISRLKEEEDNMEGVATVTWSKA